MIGIVVITHGRLAEELIATMEHVTGKQDEIMSVCLFPDDDIDKKRQEVIEKVKLVNKGKGVIVFTDMFGGTPSNLAISVLKTGEVEVVAGINLPMLVKAAQDRSNFGLESLIKSVVDAGKKYISVASTLLNK